MSGAEKPADESITRQDFLAEILWKCSATIAATETDFCKLLI
jgi:hypothetical protein